MIKPSRNGGRQGVHWVNMSRSWTYRAFGLLAAAWPCCSNCAMSDTVWFKDENGKQRQVVGNVLGQDQSGTILLEGLDTQYHYIDEADRLRWEQSDQPEKLYSMQQLRAHLRKELGAGFNVVTRKHYVVAYSCSPEFAEHAGQILERAHDHFLHFFRNKGGFRFPSLRQPLVAIIYGSRDEYLKNIKDIGGSSLHWSGGAYLQHTNRFYTYEQTLQVAPADAATVNPTRLAEAQSSLRHRNVQTIVHEGVHQLAFNLGFHSRFSYNPKWLVEGMALYFESGGDSDSSFGWNGAGEINDDQMKAFKNLYPRLKQGFLHALVTDDDAFMNSSTNGDAYAATWAVNYYLLKSKTRGYVRYIRLIAERPIKPYTADERINDFRTAFGKSPESLELDFRRFMAPMLDVQTAH